MKEHPLYFLEEHKSSSYLAVIILSRPVILIAFSWNFAYTLISEAMSRKEDNPKEIWISWRSYKVYWKQEVLFPSRSTEIG